MVDLNAVSHWLNNRLTKSLVTEVWIFGSVLQANHEPKDVDVFVKYLDGRSKFIPNLKRDVQSGFAEHFGVPLHTLCLNHSESDEASLFLRSALRNGLRVR